MKYRLGFVSNSSSASFVIAKIYLTQEQIDLIKRHGEVAGNDAWDINIDEHFVTGATYIDNFDFEEYLIGTVGVAANLIQWDI